MTTPRVTEIPPQLSAVERDPFVDAPSRAPVVRHRRDDRDAAERRLGMVRSLLRARAAAAATGTMGQSPRSIVR